MNVPQPAAFSAKVNAALCCLLRPFNYLRERFLRPVVVSLASHGEQIEALSSQLSRTQEQLMLLSEENRRLREFPAHLFTRVEKAERVLAWHSESIGWVAEKLACNSVAPTKSKPAGELGVSILMPVWNRCDQVCQAVDSVLAQSSPNWELVIVDDGSIDHTWEVLLRYKDEPRVRLLRQEHLGVAAARNRALAASRFPVIAYLDSDNTIFPDFVAEVNQVFAENPGVQTACFAQLVHCPLSGVNWIRAHQIDYPRLRDMACQLDLNVFCHRRELYERHGGFDESLNRLVDWDLILRYIIDAPPMMVPRLISRYQEGNWSRITNQQPLQPNIDRIRAKQPVVAG